MLVQMNLHARTRAFQVGDVVLVQLLNGIENRHSLGKTRPAVLVHEDHGHWLVMGLTTRSTYEGGEPRVAIPNPHKVGLNGPGYLWGSRLARISRLDVIQDIGSVDRPLAEAVIDLAGLHGAWAVSLLLAARDGDQ